MSLQIEGSSLRYTSLLTSFFIFLMSTDTIPADYKDLDAQNTQ